MNWKGDEVADLTHIRITVSQYAYASLYILSFIQEFTYTSIMDFLPDIMPVHSSQEKIHILDQFLNWYRTRKQTDKACRSAQKSQHPVTLST